MRADAVMTLVVTRHQEGGGAIVLTGQGGRRTTGTATGERMLGQMVSKAVLDMLAPPERAEGLISRTVRPPD